MRRSYSDLTARKVIRDHKAACEAGEKTGTTKFSWGQGLVLAVAPSGSASWIARVQAPNGKRRDIGVGRFGEVSIEEARARVAEHKAIAREGKDPKAVKDAARAAARNPVPTFRAAAKAVHAERSPGFRNSKHADQWINSLRDHAFKAIGNLVVDEVDGPAVTRMLKPIWTTKPETARRVLQRTAAIIAWAVAHGHRDHELPVNAIRMGLADQPKGKSHHRAVPVEDAPAVFAKITTSENTSAKCLALAILTASRSNEARGARWEEVDIAAATWTIPGDRTKTAKPHVVALSPMAVDLLRDWPVIENKAGLIFPNAQGKPLSDVAVTKALRAAGTDATVHGWRSTFRDWTAERTNVPGEVAEAALAHVVSNKVEAAYRRTNYLEKRRPLMKAWGDFLTGASANVANIDEARKLKESTG